MFKKTIIPLFGIGIMLLTACSKKDSSDCENKICDESFATVIVKFVNKNGDGVAVKNYSSVNQRTGDTLSTSSDSDIYFEAGIYRVVSDNNLRKLSEEGDDIKVSGTLAESGQTKSAIIKIKGGNCACHISKVSGPEQIKFD